ncbi:MAG: ABC transporter ATP-binding protein, partial [Thermoplasmata archaeon]|nr:ABC transporter ATP-binding protein [Thermoplasmata archaeon]
MAQVLIRDMTKRFGDVVAVDQLNLDIKDNEFVVFLGPSGCGKTTSLRCIAGLETPEEGEILIGDRVVNDLEPKDRDVAMVFQNYALYPHMTVAQNMAFPLQNFGVPVSEINKRILEASHLLEIKPLLDRKPTALSGGQQQRVALGRAIVRHPKVFLMDEPLSNLDAKLRVHMRAELKRLQKDLGVTTIYVTHDQVEAMTMGDRIAIMEDGVLQQFDAPNSIYDHPVNQFVAGFVGTPPINFIEMSYTSDASLDAGEFRFPISENLARAARSATSDEVVLAVRPQDVIV